ALAICVSVFEFSLSNFTTEAQRSHRVPLRKPDSFSQVGKLAFSGVGGCSRAGHETHVTSTIIVAVLGAADEMTLSHRTAPRPPTAGSRHPLHSARHNVAETSGQTLMSGCRPKSNRKTGATLTANR